jgi:hypothetical protein
MAQLLPTVAAEAAGRAVTLVEVCGGSGIYLLPLNELNGTDDQEAPAPSQKVRCPLCVLATSGFSPLPDNNWHVAYPRATAVTYVLATYSPPSSGARLWPSSRGPPISKAIFQTNARLRTTTMSHVGAGTKPGWAL